MPAKIRKKGSKYQVSTPNGIHAKGTTKEKAMAQQRLLNAIDHGWKPSKSYFYLDKDSNMYRNTAELYEAYMRKVCGVKESA